MLTMPPALATKSGDPEDPALGEQLADRVGGELVVGGAGDRAAAQLRHGLVVEHAAERARGEHVDVGGQRACAGRSTRAPSRSASSRRLLVDVGERRASRRPRRAARPAGRRRWPTPDHGDAAALERRRCRSARSQATRIAASTPSAVHGLGSPDPPLSTARPVTWLGHLGDHPHVGLGRADVLGGEVGAVERLDGVAEVEQHGAAASPVGGAVPGGQHDHALAAAEREAGDGGLEGHRAREPQRVAHRRARVGVGPHPAAAQRRPARGRVHRDDRVEARPPPAADEQRLVGRAARGTRWPRA